MSFANDRAFAAPHVWALGGSLLLHALVLTALPSRMQPSVRPAMPAIMAAFVAPPPRSGTATEPLPTERPVRAPSQAPFVAPVPVVAPKPMKRRVAVRRPAIETKALQALVPSTALSLQPQVLSSVGEHGPESESKHSYSPGSGAGGVTAGKTAGDPRGAQGAGDGPLTPARFDAAYLNNPSPPYPNRSRRLGEEGKVILRVRVSSEGDADEVEIKASSGSARLDDSALQTVRRWHFIPARRGSDTIESWVLVPVLFRLE